jgi:HSP20 family molecular chaperone IbpA
MTTRQFAGADDRFLRRYEYDDRWIVAGDVGAGDADVDVDVVGTTAIVVIDTGDGVRETEFELPDTGADADVTLQNGVLTITVQK